MSYEGYSQFLCKKGHYWTTDCNMTAYSLETNYCPDCGESAVWENMVNVTNGSFDINPKTMKEERIDGYVELEIKEQKSCDKCHRPIEITYKIPDTKKRSKK